VKRLAGFALLVCAAGCHASPEFVIVDRATALEQQASGSFDDVEQRLNRAAIEPRPVPLTPERLATLGLAPAVTAARAGDATDAERLDALLTQRCAGEGRDGLVVATPDACRGAADAETLATLVERTNRARRQLWRWMHEQRPGAGLDELRVAWRRAHLAGVVCGGWIEEDAGWRAKEC